MRVQHLKIVVAWRINSGKSTFIGCMDETEVVPLVNGWTRSDYARYFERTQHKRNLGIQGRIRAGKITVNDSLALDLYRASSNLPSMSSIPRDMHGFLVLVDSTDERSFYEGRALLLYMAHFPSVPFMVVANKQDVEGALTVEQVRRKMRLIDRILVIGCTAKDRDSVRNVLIALLDLILET